MRRRGGARMAKGGGDGVQVLIGRVGMGMGLGVE